MEQNLIDKAKSMIVNFTGGSGQEEEAEVIKNAIQAAYDVATEEEKQELKQLEQQLNELL